ncbi:MAG: hypothetical protein E6294_16640, partial [Klebsiella sp.]|nr:hypothetical protein [Klebsiella sp.]
GTCCDHTCPDILITAIIIIEMSQYHIFSISFKMKSINKMISEIELNIYGNCIITSNLNDRISSNISDVSVII